MRYKYTTCKLIFQGNNFQIYYFIYPMANLGLSVFCPLASAVNLSEVGLSESGNILTLKIYPILTSKKSATCQWAFKLRPKQKLFPIL